jgi:outer membrane receptor for ferrienterochelin and colicins
MKTTIWLLLTVFHISVVFGQNTFKAIIKEHETNETLIGVTALLKGTNNAAVSDKDGLLILHNIPNGQQTIVFKYIGFEELEKSLEFPTGSSEPLEIVLFPHHEELEEIIVQSTRTSRTIQNVPTRIETIELEEIEEKSNMRPSNISMLLHESTGIQVQQTSATSANASIRIQGLDGKYTQLLKDGYPGFGNFASGLSILEIPPLDLQQVEVIKGPSSTLYSGGAIAGVVNFISKTPKEKAQYDMIINQSHVGQTNTGIFAAKRKGKLGYTVLGLLNLQRPYDVDKDDFTELPESVDFTINPKLFIYPTQKMTIQIGNSFTKGDRTGGDIFVIRNQASAYHTYFEKNNSLRNTSTFQLDYMPKEKNRLQIKQSFGVFSRQIEIPAYHFGGMNYNSFSDISYLTEKRNHSLIGGVNFIYDRFVENDALSGSSRDNTNTTAGLYVQDTWDASAKIKLESGLRLDAANYKNDLMNETKMYILPRVSVLFNLTEKLSSRIGGGMGYKAPTIFTEQTEALQYRNVMQLNNVRSEDSYGGTADINYKTPIGEHFYFSINQLFFYTQINNPLVLYSDTVGNVFFVNEKQPIQSLGFETNVKLIFKEDFKLFMGYTYTDAKAKYLSGNQDLPLVGKGKLNFALLYENHKIVKVGLEGFYTDQQPLGNGASAPAYWEFGAMVEKPFGKISVYLNAENFTDTRQSNYKRVVNEPHNDPTFDEIWTHTEGFVFSGGIKIKL